jgi:glycosyltransferase involved in cell wall biosynthesis
MMREDKPLVSIVIPSYNQGEYLAQCLDSILSQDYRPLEILVMDGASTDSTLSVLDSYRDRPEIKYWSEKDSGPASAVNKGLQHAKGSVIGIQCADDYYLPGAIGEAVAAFVEHPSVGLVYGEVQSVTASGQIRRVSRRPPHENALCIALGICIPQCSAFFRAEVAQPLHGWREQYHTCDWDYWLRMMFRTTTLKFDRAWSAWRMYPGQRTKQNQKVYDSFVRMLDDSPEIQHGDARIKRASRAAKLLIAMRFGPPRSPLQKLVLLLRATLIFPQVWNYVPNKSTLVPGYSLLRRRNRGQLAPVRLKP